MSFKYTIPKVMSNKSDISKNNLLNSVKNKISNISKNVSNKSTNITSKFQKMSNTVSENVSDFNWKHILLIIFIIILIILVILILNYVINDCYQKKYLGEYILDGAFDPCQSKSEPSTYKERVRENEKEVFHIANQDYTYEQAKCKCEAYNGRLATKDDIIRAYNKGAEWCTYGWSEGQTAYYPTQKCTWDKLQKGDPARRMDCGMPGVNGGFFGNPNLKFGINCYGIRPKGEIVREKDPVCKGEEFCKIKTNYFAANRLDTDEIVPFNSDQWSQFG
jgi:hypothetical protein